MKFLFTILFYIDIVLAAVSFVLAFIILRRRHNPIYFNFGISNLFLALWLTAISLMIVSGSPHNVSFVNLTFLFGILILHFFAIFTFRFPVKDSRDDKKIIIIYLLTAIMSVPILIPGFYTISAESDFPFLRVNIGRPWLTIFSVYFLALSIMSFRNLVKKYFTSDGIYKTQLFKIIIGTAVAVFANFIFSISIYHFTSFDTNLIGAPFTFAVIVYIYSILFSKK